MHSRLSWSLTVTVCWLGLLCLTVAAREVDEELDEGHYYTHSWVVHVPHTLSKKKVDEVARAQGFINNGMVMEVDDQHIYEFHHHDVEKQSSSRAHQHHEKLTAHEHVLHAEQQVSKVRRKRGFIPVKEHDVQKRSASFNDPLWSSTWYLHGGALGGYDMNTTGAWNQGYTGKNVVITILDDGIERTHPDLQPNYDPEASYDINNSTHGRIDKDPMPRYDYTNENRHGTRCAGEVSSAANNNVCSVGAAYDSKIGGVRMLDGPVTDSVEARSLGLNPNHVDIYSSSWGPDDNGRTLDGPGRLAKQSFVDGVTKGRNGKGNIFVWASGNGGNKYDSCACDGYTNSPYTLSVSAVAESNTRPWYLEQCASTLASTYSSGRSYGQKKIVSTDLHHKCTTSHSGTSAAAPLASGLLALALEANPNLTWRDMQYVVLLTSNPDPLIDGEWALNGVGRKVSHLYGYGLMNAGRMTSLAKKWRTVPPQVVQELPADEQEYHLGSKGVKKTITVGECSSSNSNCVRYLESVQLVLSAVFSRRGDLKLIVTSPSGTRSTLLPRRVHDSYNRPINAWPYLSVHFWGENPAGEWTMELQNTGSSGNSGTLSRYQLVLRGSATNPLANICPHLALITNSECVESCPTGTYEDPDRMCRGCRGNCLECERSGTGSKCNVCAKDFFQYKGVCLDKCPPNTIQGVGECRPECLAREYKGADLRCHPCHTSCGSCSGPSEVECTLCDPPGWLFNHTCMESCPSNAYALPVNHQECDICHESCKTCFGPADNNCHGCAVNHTLNYDHQCVLVQICASGEYKLSIGSCAPCDGTCETCSGPSNSDCLSCSKASFLLEGRQCVTECPNGQYEMSASVSQERNVEMSGSVAAVDRCVPCQVDLCKSCNSTDSCGKCYEGATLETDGMCNTTCGSGLYHAMKGGSSLCLPCPEGCAVCNAAEQCQRCEDNLLMMGSKCVQTCEQGWSLGQEKGTCVQCKKQCLSCQENGHTCTQCAEDKRLVHGRCEDLPQCYPGQYLNGSSMACHSCHPWCEMCSGPSESQCIACSSPRKLLKGKCILCCTEGQDFGDADCCLCHGGKVDKVDCLWMTWSKAAKSNPLPDESQIGHRSPNMIKANMSIIPVIVVSVALIILIPLTIFCFLQVKSRTSHSLCCTRLRTFVSDDHEPLTSNMQYAKLATKEDAIFDDDSE